MRKIIFTVLLATVNCFAQDSLPNRAKHDIVTPKGDSYIHRAGTRYTRSTYTEVYEVLTDSIVYRFGLMFRSADSSFIKRVPLDGTVRTLYDRMQADTEFILKNQERLREETIKTLNRHRTSPKVWWQFMLLDIFDK